MRERTDGGVRPEAILAVLLIISALLIIFTRVVEENERGAGGKRLILSIQLVAGNAVERIKDGFGSLKRLREMREQYESVLNTLSNYRGIEREVIDLRRENEALRIQLGKSLEMENENIPARIIAGDPSNLFASLTIDRGTRDGIRAGMAVTAFQDGFFGLLGKVVTVNSKSSQVRPIVDPDHYVACRFQGSRYQGLVQGRGNEDGELLMQYVRKSAGNAIGINDLVVTSGMRSIYPQGIYVGRVKEVRSREYAASLEIVLHPVIDVTRIEYVFVLNGSG